MQRRSFLKTIGIGLAMSQLPASFVLAKDSINTTDELYKKMTEMFNCTDGEPRAFMEMPIARARNMLDERTVKALMPYKSENGKDVFVRMTYSTFAFCVAGGSEMVAEAKLAQYFYEGFKTIAGNDKPTLLWRSKPTFESEIVKQYGELYATREEIEDDIVKLKDIPPGYEEEFATGNIRKLVAEVPYYRMRMRLVIPEYQNFEQLEEMVKPEGMEMPKL